MHTPTHVQYARTRTHARTVIAPITHTTHTSARDGPSANGGTSTTSAYKHTRAHTHSRKFDTTRMHERMSHIRTRARSHTYTRTQACTNVRAHARARTHARMHSRRHARQHKHKQTNTTGTQQKKYGITQKCKFPARKKKLLKKFFSLRDL